MQFRAEQGLADDAAAALMCFLVETRDQKGDETQRRRPALLSVDELVEALSDRLLMVSTSPR